MELFSTAASLQKVIRHNRRSANYHVHRHVGLQSGDLFREQNNIRHLVLHVDGGSPSCGSRPLELLQGFFSQDRILRDGLDLDHTLVGLKPDLAECGQVVKTLADVEVGESVSTFWDTPSGRIVFGRVVICIWGRVRRRRAFPGCGRKWQTCW
jgi:hypothetical protein